MIENLISFFIASILLALSPGPDNIYVITQSLANGTKSGIATTIGLVSGCIIHTTLLAFGISLIIITSGNIFYGIKVVGPRARLEVKALLKELRNMGKTILISSHILTELADC